MYRPTALQENFIKDLNRAPPQRNFSRWLVAFFAVYQFLFGLNFGFVESNGILKMATRFATAAAGFIISVILLLSVVLIEFRSRVFLVYFAQYIPIHIILNAAKFTLCSFLNDLKNENEAYTKLGLFLWLYTSISFLAKIATSIVNCYLTTCTDYRLMIVDIIIHIPMVALDIVPVASLVIFYHVYARLKDLRLKYEQREINLKQLRTSFKQVADNFDKIRSSYDAIFVWEFVTESSKWMFIIWHQLKLLRYSSSWWLYGCSYIWATLITVHICVPAAFAEMISVETDAMKMILSEQLMVETDERMSSELSRLLRYVEARPLLRKAWRLVPLDLQLPVTMLSMCATYLIVIIQFSHLYD